MRNESPSIASSSADLQELKDREARICVVQEVRPESALEFIKAGKELLLEYGRFVQSQSGVASFCFGALEKEVANLPASYLSQGGGALLAGFYRAPSEAVGETVIQTRLESGSLIPGVIHWAGFIAWRTLPLPHLARASEVKRLWVRPEARGLRMGRLLVQAVIDRAIRDGKTELLLDTAPSAMDCAYRLYSSMGFVECPPYYEHAIEGILYMRKTL